MGQFGFGARRLQTQELQRKERTVHYRIVADGDSYVLKWYLDPAHAIEGKAYQLFVGAGVPTLQVFRNNDQGLVLQDLLASKRWRVAVQDDLQSAAFGAALGAWYGAFHRAGHRLISDRLVKPDFLPAAVDTLNPASLMFMAKLLGLKELPVWQLAADHIELLKAALAAFPSTFNHNEFDWTNCAVTRETPLRAIVFDYHHPTIGPASWDAHNARHLLGPEGRAGFDRAYGPLNPGEVRLYAPLALLLALQVTAAQPIFPAWGKRHLERLTKGELELLLRDAIAWCHHPEG